MSSRRELNAITARYHVAEDWTPANIARLIASLTPESIAREERWFRRHKIRSAASTRRKRRGW